MILAMDMSIELSIVHLIRRIQIRSIFINNGNVRRKLQENEANPQTYEKASFCTTHLSRPGPFLRRKVHATIDPTSLFEGRQCRSRLQDRTHQQKTAITSRLHECRAVSRLRFGRVSSGEWPERREEVGKEEFQDPLVNAGFFDASF